MKRNHIHTLQIGYQSLKTIAMRRSLVLTDESARHPFRAIQPMHNRNNKLEAPAEVLWKLTRDDVRGFATTYIAALAAIIVFIT